MKRTKSIAAILFMLLTLNFISCEKENLNSNEIIKEKLKNDITQKTFQEILNDNEFRKAYKKTLKFKERNLEGARTASDTNSDFTIDSTSVNIVTTDKFTSYSMRITRDNPHPSYTENLLIQVDSTGISKSFIVKYTPSVQIEEVESHGAFKFQGSVEAIDIEYDLPSLRVDEDCITIWVRFCDWSTGSIHGEVHLAGPNCTPGFMFWEPLTACDGDDGGGFDDDGFSYDYGNSSPDGGGGTGSGGGAPVIHPCDDPIHGCNAIAGRIASRLNLNYAEREWLYSQSQIMITNLDDLYNNNAGSQVIKTLIRNAINDFISYSVTNYPGKNEGYPYEWWNDTNFIKNSGNFDMPSNTNVAVEQTPNVVELALFAIFPREAILHKLNADTAIAEAEVLASNNTFNQPFNVAIEDGKADAFRHAYWNALDNSDFDKLITKAFTDAHEAFSTGLPKQMDLFNNEKGRDIGDNYSPSSNESVIAISVRVAITNGTLKYIDNNGNLVFTNQ